MGVARRFAWVQGSRENRVPAFKKRPLLTINPAGKHRYGEQE